MRVLIIKTSALGDIIHALPVLDYLHQVVPEVAVDWVVEESFAELLSGNQLIDRLIVVAFKRWKKLPFSLSTMREIGFFRRCLQEQDYDFVFDVQGNTKSGLICWLANSHNKIGFDHDNIQEKLNALFTNQKIAFHSLDQHVTVRYLRIISEPFGIDPANLKLKTDIYTADDDEAAGKIVSQARGGPILLLHMGTTWKTKLWHEIGWITLARDLLAYYPRAAILLSWGNASEHDSSVRIAQQIGDRVQVLEKMSLKRFAALLKLVDVVVGGDTGPVHLAAVVGTATVSFYRSTDGSLNGPKGESHVIVQSSLACTKCLKKTCERNEVCVGSITPEVMGNGVKKILNGRCFDSSQKNGRTS